MRIKRRFHVGEKERGKKRKNKGKRETRNEKFFYLLPGSNAGKARKQTFEASTSCNFFGLHEDSPGSNQWDMLPRRRAFLRESEGKVLKALRKLYFIEISQLRTVLFRRPKLIGFFFKCAVWDHETNRRISLRIIYRSFVRSFVRPFVNYQNWSAHSLAIKGVFAWPHKLRQHGSIDCDTV